MKLSDFVSQVFSESKANRIQFDVAVHVENDEIIVSDYAASINGMSVEPESRLKFTIENYEREKLQK